MAELLVPPVLLRREAVRYHRLQEPIGYVSPVEYEEAYYRALEAQAEGVGLNSPSLR